MKDTPTMGDNSQSRYDQCKTDLARLEEIKAEKKALSDEAGTIIKRLETDGGVNRGALAEIRKMLDLSPAAIQAREESRKELFGWMIAPKLEEAAQGQSDE